MATISKVAICASRLSIEDRREAVKNLTDEGLGLREVGDILGVSHQTVANDVKDLTERFTKVVPVQYTVRYTDLTPTRGLGPSPHRQ